MSYIVKSYRGVVFFVVIFSILFGVYFHVMTDDKGLEILSVASWSDGEVFVEKNSGEICYLVWVSGDERLVLAASYGYFPEMYLDVESDRLSVTMIVKDGGFVRELYSTPRETIKSVYHKRLPK